MPNPECQISLGPLYQDFNLTLEPGRRWEVLGPIYQYQSGPKSRFQAVPPLFSYTADDAVDSTEFDFLYPIFTWDRYGEEYRVQLLQWLNFTGGRSLSDTNAHRFTLFPLYFQQRSLQPEKNYTALFPIYGHLKNRFFRDEASFVLWPVYVQSRKRDTWTYNFVFPFVHVRRGPELSGWQFWPLVGHESKDVTSRTNGWNEVEVVGGHKKSFVLWPFYFRNRTGLGTTNAVKQDVLLPFYSSYRSDWRRSITAPWPLGYSHTVDREKQYTEWAAPWPIVVFARGPGKNVSRVLPFYSRAKSEVLEQNAYLWPIYKYRRVTSTPLDRERTRILFFLYSDVNELNTETKASKHRNDLWPLYTYRHDSAGNRRLQLLAPLEPILPGNKNIERNYSPLWSLWRWEKNGPSSASSQSLLWNLYRRETSPAAKKCSLLFGLFQYQSSAEGRQWRVFYLPLGSKAGAKTAAAAHP